MQAQSVGPHPSNNTLALAGFQDNGSARFDGTQPAASSWTQVDAADSGFTLFDQLSPQFAYHTSATTSAGPSGSRSSDTGVSFSSASSTSTLRAAMSSANDTGAAYYPPLALDPSAAQRAIFGARSIDIAS